MMTDSRPRAAVAVGPADRQADRAAAAVEAAEGRPAAITRITASIRTLVAAMARSPMKTAMTKTQGSQVGKITGATDSSNRYILRALS